MQSLTEKELSLIHALQIAPRVTWAQASEVLDAHPTVLANRWEHLRSQGIAWVTAQLTGRARKQVLSFGELTCKLGKLESVARTVVEVPEIMSVDLLSQHHTLGLTMVGDSLETLVTETFPQLNMQLGVQSLESMICIGMHTGAEAWRLRSLERVQIEALTAVHRGQSGMDPSLTLGPEHVKVIELLQRDGRATAADISRVTGTSAATARRYLTKVLASDVVALRTDMAQSFSGFPITAQWFTRLPAAEHTAAAQRLGRAMNPRLVASSAGRANFLVALWLGSVNDMLTAERAIEAHVPGIEILESAVMMGPRKRLGWVLRADGTATGRLVSPPVSVE